MFFFLYSNLEGGPFINISSIPISFMNRGFLPISTHPQIAEPITNSCHTQPLQTSPDPHQKQRNKSLTNKYVHFKQTVELNYRNHKHKQSDHDGMFLHQNTEKSHSNPSCTAMKQKPQPNHEKHLTKMCPATTKIPTAIELHSSNQDTFNPRVPLLISSCSSQTYSLCHYQGTLKLQGLVVDLLIKKTE